MKRWLTICLAVCMIFGTTLGMAEGEANIQRRPVALDIPQYWSALSLEEYMTPDEYGHVDVRSADVSGADLAPYAKYLTNIDFDDRTLWPEKLPEGFDPEQLMALGKDPGCNVRLLHERGLTGKNVGIAIIDQTLLVDHVEYADAVRYYAENEEIAAANEPASMHGPAVASIALGETVGVAPDALLYHVAEIVSQPTADGGWVRDCTYVAETVERLIELNETLPEDEKIRVISISMGWMPEHIGAKEIDAALQKAKDSGIAVCAIGDRDVQMFAGMARDPYADPNDSASARPGLFWESYFWNAPQNHKRLLIPMDYRGLASPTGTDEYAFYAMGGMSWVMPYLAGLYALAWEAVPGVTFEAFTEAAWASAKPAFVESSGKAYQFGYYVDAVTLIDTLIANN